MLQLEFPEWQYWVVFSKLHAAMLLRKAFADWLLNRIIALLHLRL